MIAPAAPTKAATEPTDRSMWRATITITMPMARIRICAFCTTRLETLSGLSSTPSVVIWKSTTIAASAMIMPYWRMLPRRMLVRVLIGYLASTVMYRIRDSWVGVVAVELMGDHALGEGVDPVAQPEQLGQLRGDHEHALPLAGEAPG